MRHAMKHARKLMTANPETVNADDPIADAARVMRALDAGFLLVVESEGSRQLVGLITDRDITIRHVAEDHDGTCRVREHMSTDPVVVYQDTSLKEVLRRMEQHGVRRLPVVDQDRKLVGVIARADVLRDLGPTDPEAVEEVEDEISEPMESIDEGDDGDLEADQMN